jgi:hypothetical protein
MSRFSEIKEKVEKDLSRLDEKKTKIVSHAIETTLGYKFVSRYYLETGRRTYNVEFSSERGTVLYTIGDYEEYIESSMKGGSMITHRCLESGKIKYLSA